MDEGMKTNPEYADAEYADDDAIVALASPWGESAIAVIRLSGQDCLEKINGVFTGKVLLTKSRSHTIHHGRILYTGSKEAIDDVLSHGQREAIVKGYSGTAGFALEQVNRPRPVDAATLKRG